MSFTLSTISRSKQVATIEYVLHCNVFTSDDMAMSGLVGYGSSDEEAESVTSRLPIRREVKSSNR